MVSGRWFGENGGNLAAIFVASLPQWESFYFFESKSFDQGSKEGGLWAQHGVKLKKWVKHTELILAWQAGILHTRCAVGTQKCSTVGRTQIKSHPLPPSVFLLVVAFLFGESLSTDMSSEWWVRRVINKDGENETKPSFLPLLIVLSQKAEMHGRLACHPGTFAVLFCDCNNF